MSAFPDPTFEAMATLHRVRSEFAVKYNRGNNNADLLACSVLDLAIIRAVIRLEEIMPAAEFEALRMRLLAEMPTIGLVG